MQQKLRQPLQICLLALVNWLLFCGLTVFLARTLDTRGFVLFSARSLLLASITVGLLYATVRLVVAEDSLSELWPILAGVAVVPAVALSHLLIEILAASGEVACEQPFSTGSSFRLESRSSSSGSAWDRSTDSDAGGRGIRRLVVADALGLVDRDPKTAAGGDLEGRSQV